MGGGGSKQTTETRNTIAPGLEGAYRAAGSLGEDLLGQIAGIMPGYLSDSTVQHVAKPTDLENAAAGAQAGLLEGSGPQAWSDALGMYNSLGSLPSWGGVDLGGIQGWGGMPAAPEAAGGPRRVGGQPSQPGFGKVVVGDDNDFGEPVGGGGGGYDPTGGGGYDPEGGSQSLVRKPPTPGPSVNTPGATDVPWTQASAHQGISAPGMGVGPQTGSVRDIDTAYRGGSGGSGGGGGSWGSSGGGGGAKLDRIDNPLQNIDFANHPALASALDTFAKTALPGIENSMIGAGLGRSGAAANAISTGKANIALPVMQQLIQGELANKGYDVTQRGQDINQNIAGAQSSAGRYAANLAHQAALRGQDIGLRAQDIGLRGQDINALMEQGAQGLQARGQDIGALLSGAQGLSSLGGADLARIQDAIGGSVDLGGLFRGIENEQGQAQFLAGQRGGDRSADFLNTIMGGAMGGTGSRTTTTGGGGK